MKTVSCRGAIEGHLPEDAAFRRISDTLSADKILSILAEVFEVPVEKNSVKP